MSIKTKALNKNKKSLKLKKTTQNSTQKQGQQNVEKKLSKMAMIREKTKAIKAKSLAMKGSAKEEKRKVYHKVSFRRPHTLRQKRSPKYPRHSLLKTGKNDHYSVIEYPVTSECAMKKIEDHNTLTFVVNKKANKLSVKKAVKALHRVEVVKVNILNNHDGKRVAFVRLNQESDAVEAANKIGII